MGFRFFQPPVANWKKSWQGGQAVSRSRRSKPWLAGAPACGTVRFWAATPASAANPANSAVSPSTESHLTLCMVLMFTAGCKYSPHPHSLGAPATDSGRWAEDNGSAGWSQTDSSPDGRKYQSAGHLGH